MTDKSGMHCYVSGKVQGVWFRASTKAEAEKLGITGWARNLPDGRVEVMAYGNQAALKALHNWLQDGPDRAVVDEVISEDVPWTASKIFVIT